MDYYIEVIIIMVIEINNKFKVMVLLKMLSSFFMQLVQTLLKDVLKF